MSYLSRDELLRQIRRLETDVDLPDGRKIRIRELMAEDRIAAQEAADADPETRHFRNVPGFYARIVQRGVLTGPDGDLLFTEADLPALAAGRTGLRGLNIRDIGDAIWRLSEADPDSFRALGRAVDEGGDADADDRAAAAEANDGSGERGRGSGDLGADGGDGLGREPGDAR